MLEEYLEPFRKMYNILDSIGQCLPIEGETVQNPPEGCVTQYMKMFEFRFKLLFHPLGQKFLTKVNLALGRLAPNRGGVLFGLGVLWWLECKKEEDTMLLNVE